jgi:hypothetical protein
MKFVLLFSIPILAGCSTISPSLPIPAQPSMGSNGAHSLVYAVFYNAKGEIVGQDWYPEKRDTYNARIGKCGSQFLPPLQVDSHLTRDGSYWRADDTAINQFIQLGILAGKDQVP